MNKNIKLPRKFKKCLRYDDGWMGTKLDPKYTGLSFGIVIILKCVKSKFNKPRLYIFTNNSWYMESYKQDNLILCEFNRNGITRCYGDISQTHKHELNHFICYNYSVLMKYWHQHYDSIDLIKELQNVQKIK